MKADKKFKEHLADICIKIFQIVFAVLVVGMYVREQFDVPIFCAGAVISIVLLTTAIAFYYNAVKEAG